MEIISKVNYKEVEGKLIFSIGSNNYTVNNVEGKGWFILDVNLDKISAEPINVLSAIGTPDFYTVWDIVAKHERKLEEAKFMFKVGETYETQCGKLVKVLSRTAHHCIECSDGKYRYDLNSESTDSGRVTGTNHDYSHPDNFKRADKKVRTLKDFAIEAGGTKTRLGLSDAVLMTNKDLENFKLRIEEQFKYKCKRVGALTAYNVLVNSDTPEAEDCLNYPVYLFPEDRED